MATLVDRNALFSGANAKAFDEACAARAGGKSPSSVPGFFDPAAVQILGAAVRRAWQLIVVLQPASAGRRDEVIDALAAGTMRAAREGERDVGRLSRAACAYCIGRRSTADAFFVTLQ